jgi:hypothetical protein
MGTKPKKPKKPKKSKKDQPLPPMSHHKPHSYSHYAVVVPHDTNNHADGEADALYVGGAGVVIAIRPDGTAISITAVAGAILPIRTKRVNSTTTDATLMVALYARKPS